MKKTVTYITSMALVMVILNIATASFNTAEAAGCQTLSSSSLNKKASNYRSTIHKIANNYGVSPSLVKAVITVESCFRRKARGSLGEKGLMQLMPATARRFNIKNGYNASQNIQGGTRYLSYLLKRYNGNLQRAVAAYNAGEGRIGKTGRIPNKSYVRKVMQAYGKFSGGKREAFVAKKAYSPKRTTRKTAVKTVARPANKPVARKTVQKKAVVTNKQGSLPWKDINRSSAANTYRVRPGDTVYEVMRQTGVPVKKIIRLNKLSAPDKIRAGQVLRIR